MNIICVKHGSKYSSEYVNKLYSMIKRFAPSKFTLHCLTDDPIGIHPEISIIEFPINNSLEAWWNKMWAFSMFVEGDNILFDLDIIIHGDLSSLFNITSIKPMILHSYWKKHEHCYEEGNTPYNSSVVKWHGNLMTPTSNLFFTNPEYYMLKYKGVDRFIWNEKIDIDTLPNNIVYSYINNGSIMDTRYPICIFNETDNKQHNLSDTWISQYWT